jgi:threonine synthase
VSEARYPMICLETALPVKFDATIVEALGEHAPRPAAFEGIESRPQRLEVMKPDPERIKGYIRDHAAPR